MSESPAPTAPSAPRFDHVAIIVNPVAGSGAAREVLARFANRLRGAGFDCQIKITTQAADVPRLVADNTGPGRLVAVAGGDGTVRAALPSLATGASPLLILPLGTENLLARHLGIQLSVEPLLDLVLRGEIAALDLARVNQSLVATVIGVGFDAEVVARLAAVRRGHITYRSYIAPVWNTFTSYRFPPVRVSADGEQVCDEPALVFVGNIPRYALGLRILREARWDDGLLDLCVLRCSNAAQLLQHALLVVFDRHLRHHLVTYRQVRHVELDSPERLALQSDGDPAGELPARIEVVPAAIRLLVPNRPLLRVKSAESAHR